MKARSLALILAGAWIAVCSATSAHAATYYWNTTLTGNFAMGGNWSDTATTGGTTGVVPLSTDSVVFNQSSVNGIETVTFNANTSIAGITFNNTGSTLFTSDSTTSRLLTIGANGIFFNPGAGAVTLGDTTNNLNLALGANQTWEINSSNTLTVCQWHHQRRQLESVYAHHRRRREYGVGRHHQ